jgi:UDP-GlcNAc:undecaprenyl-phosphate/decaprenyl-phosphate GlcNAc-1-phosphate transferase
MFINLFPPLLWAILLTLAFVPLVTKLAVRYQIIDQPNSAPHKVHKFPIPKSGGMAISVVLFALILLGGKWVNAEIRGILLSSLIIIIFGLWDDIRHLSVGWKLFGQALATGILIWQGVYIRFTGHPIPNMLLTAFWMIGITNAFNLVDSMDGLAAGLAGIASAFFMLVTLDAKQDALAYLSAVLLGSSIAIIFFNLKPAKIFLGDLGAQLLGFVLAALAIAYTPPGLPQPSSWFVPILLLGMPIFDTTLVFFSRLRRGKAVYEAGLDHSYHRLVRLGIPPSRAVFSLHLAAIILGCVAFLALSQPPLLANAIFGVALLVGLAALIWLDQKVA